MPTSAEHTGNLSHLILCLQSHLLWGQTCNCSVVPRTQFCCSLPTDSEPYNLSSLSCSLISEPWEEWVWQTASVCGVEFHSLSSLHTDQLWAFLFLLLLPRNAIIVVGYEDMSLETCLVLHLSSRMIVADSLPGVCDLFSCEFLAPLIVSGVNSTLWSCRAGFE